MPPSQRPLPVLDFHVHTIFSDGALAPAELARRYAVKGCRILGLSDHVDQSNLETTLAGALAASRALSGEIGLILLAGVELTHVPPSSIPEMVARARGLGADFVSVHGESPVEPVAPGTNMAAIEAGCDILAHPGLLVAREAALAAQRGVFLELSVRGGHSLGNGRVATLARRHGARLIINSDAHGPGDLLTPDLQMAVALGAGLTHEVYVEIMDQAEVWASARIALAGLAASPAGPGRPGGPAGG
jgi:histidinol phosphatase-like PHP family hydrolase